jgi:hypothetical protein
MHGPFHRLESTTQTIQIAMVQVTVGEVWGTVARLGGLYPCVKAYPHALPAMRRGIDFTTQIAPDLRHSSPIEIRWYHPHTLGVTLKVEAGRDYACITAKVCNKQL